MEVLAGLVRRIDYLNEAETTYVLPFYVFKDHIIDFNYSSGWVA
jgi:hypothetical protein